MDGSQSTPPAEIRRRRFSASDVQAMLKAGVLKDGERVELLWGELVEMSPQGPLHWDVPAAAQVKGGTQSGSARNALLGVGVVGQGKFARARAGF